MPKNSGSIVDVFRERILRRCFRAIGFEILRYAPGKRRLYHGEELLLSSAGQIGLIEARFLGELVRNASADGPIIEVGTLFGESTRFIAVFKEKSQILITVDNYCWNPLGISSEAHFEVTSARLREAKEALNVQQVRIDKGEFYRTYSGAKPALVFLDAGHGYESTRDDIAWARGAGARVICGHDYTEDWPGVVRAVKEAGGPSRLVGSVWVL